MSLNSTKRNQRITHIRSSISWRDIDLSELYEYRDLIKMLIKRYFTTIYKQTILGPLWIILNPLITTVLYSVVFGNIAKISTDEIPYMLFYLSGTTLWGLFSSSLSNAQNTFLTNSGIFSKVYFPRLAAPVASTICSLINYFIQFCIFIGFCFYYYIRTDILNPNTTLFLVPVLILQAALLGMGVGTIIASWTIKYRDLGVLFSFALQLWMYLTPVIYPMSSTGSLMRFILMFNPMSPVMEAFRYAFFGVGELNWMFLGISVALTFIFLVAGILLFNHAEKTSVDTI